MNVIHYGQGNCEKTRGYLDSYLSNELLVETNHAVIRHLESCQACSRELEARARVRKLLQRAVKQETAPAYLAKRIQKKLRERQSRSFLTRPWGQWMLAVAAVLLLTLGTLATLRISYRRAERLLANRPAQDSLIQALSQQLSAILRVGFRDHVHCAVFRRYTKDPPTAAQMAKTMGPDYAGLISLVREKVPSEYRIVLAHRCGYKGRKYIHLSLKSESKLLSVVITRKEPGESFASDKLSPVMAVSGVPIYRQATGHFQVAGFETRDYLAFVVSDLGAKGNLQIAENLASEINHFLTQLEG